MRNSKYHTYSGIYSTICDKIYDLCLIGDIATEFFKGFIISGREALKFQYKKDMVLSKAFYAAGKTYKQFHRDVLSTSN